MMEISTRELTTLANRLPKTDLMLEGITTDGRHVEVDSTATGIFYVLDTACAACALNYPFLNTAADSGYSVWGVALRDSRSGLANYAGSNAIDFDIVSDVSGHILQLVPSRGTPIAVVVVDGEVTRYVFGRIDEQEQEYIVRDLRRIS